MFGFGTVNKAILIGYIAKTPKMIKLPDGKSKISFLLATQKEWVSNSGEIKTAVDWHNIVAYGNLADSIFTRALKRNLVYISGIIKTRSWKDENQHINYITEIVIDGEGSQYQTLRKVKETTEFPTVNIDEKIELSSEQKEAILVDEIEALLLVDVDFLNPEK